MARSFTPPRRRPPWPLLAAGVLATGNVFAVLLLPTSVARGYGAVSFGISVGALTMVVTYARLLRHPIPSGRTVLLVGGPCDGRLLLNRSSKVPNELWLAGADGCISAYQRTTGGSAQRRILRYRPPEPVRPVADR